MKRIMVAVDGSEAAGRALTMAISIAQKFEASLTAINVFTPAYVPPEPYAFTDGSVEQSLQRYGEACARSAAELAQKQGVTADWSVVIGAAAESISEVAHARQYDLVVVGSRGRGAVTRTLLGSVSSRLAHVCTKPLLIVH